MNAPASFDPAQLERHRHLLEALASTLTSGDEAPEDMVSQTTLRALQRRPSTDRGFRSWLVLVLRRIAGRACRAAAHRARHERASAPLASSPSALDVAAAMELVVRVSALLRELDEPYRSTLFLRYYEDLTPTQIAEREQVPLATVKSRLARGLDRMRRALQGSSPDPYSKRSASGWSWAMLLDLRLRPIARLVEGLTIMTPKTQVAIGLACVIVVSAVFWSPEANPPLRTESGDPVPMSSAVGSLADPDARPNASGADLKPERTESQTPRPLPFARGIVTGDHGRPVPDVRVLASVVNRSNSPRLWATGIDEGREPYPTLAVSDGDGCFVVEEPIPDMVGLLFVGDKYAPVRFADLAADRTRNQQLEVQLTRGVFVSGVVVDTDGAPIPDAQVGIRCGDQVLEAESELLVGICEYSTYGGAPFQRVFTGADGAFSAITGSEGQVSLSVSAMGYETMSPRVFAPRSVLRRVCVFADVRSAADGAPIEDPSAMVVDVASRRLISSQYPARFVWVRRPPKGRCVVGFPGKWRRGEPCRLVVRAPGFRSLWIPLANRSDEEPPHLQVSLEPGFDPASLAGVVRGTSRAVVEVRWHPPEHGGMGWEDLPVIATTVTSSDGQFSVSGLPDGQYRMGIFADGCSLRWLDVGAPRLDLQVELQADAAMVVRVVDESGQPAADKVVHVENAAVTLAWSVRTDGAGVATFERLPAGVVHVGAFEMLLYDIGDNRPRTLGANNFLESARHVLAPGERREVTLRMPQRVHVDLQVVDGQGRAPSDVEIRILDAEGPAQHIERALEWQGASLEERGIVFDATGWAALDLWEGSYLLQLAHQGLTFDHVLEVKWGRPATETWRVPIGAGTTALKGHVVERGSRRPLADAEVFLRLAAEKETHSGSVRVRTDEAGWFHADAIPRGKWSVAIDPHPGGAPRPGDPHYATTFRDLVCDSESVDVELAVPRLDVLREPGDATTELEIRVIDASTQQPLARAPVWVKGWIDNVCCSLLTHSTDQDGFVRATILGANRYQVEVHSPQDPGETRQTHSPRFLEARAESGRLARTVELPRAND